MEHFTYDKDGTEKWFNGIAFCEKSDILSELVISYNCENKLYAFGYNFFFNSDVKLIPVTCDYFVGKKSDNVLQMIRRKTSGGKYGKL